MTDTAPSRLLLDILNEIVDHFGATLAAAYRVDEETDGIVLAGTYPESDYPVFWFPLGVGLIGRSARDGVAFSSDDLLADPRVAHPELARLIGRSMLVAPIKADASPIGILTVSHADPNRFDEQDLAWLSDFARQLAPELARCPTWRSTTAGQVRHQVDVIREVLAEERRQRRVMEELHGIAQAITAAKSPDDALAAVVLAVSKLFGATSASVYLVDDRGGIARRRFTTRHTGAPHWDDHVRARPAGVTMTVLRSGQAVVVEDAAADARTREIARPDQGAFAAIPVRYADRVVGVLFVDWIQPRIWRHGDVRLLETLATYGAIAIENARLREQERQARAEAIAEHERLQKFLDTIAHDLRGPLTLMVAYTELLRQGTAEEQFEAAQQALPGLENAARRVQRLVNDLVDLARIGAGRFDVQPALIDLAGIIRQIAEQLQETTSQHRLLVDVPESLPGEWDPARVRQVLTSLITNAIQYSPDGGNIRIVGRRREREVEISIADPGVGIAPDQMSRLFLPFSRLDPEPTTRDTGLGLYFAKAIVEAHGGRIWLQSRTGKGSTFFIALPVHPEPLT